LAGIYLHIPFCKQACHYCDFHFSTSLATKPAFLAALKTEIQLRKPYLEGQEIQTIYFGGGTPSLLESSELQEILDEIYSCFAVASNAEITLEANPDDLTKAKLKALKESGINRLSIGIQSFRDEDLQFMNRAHNTSEALQCVKDAQELGFDNITIDLIYGIPELSEAAWKQNLQQAFNLNVQHVSAYCLTVEAGTALHHFVKTGKSKPVNEDEAAQQFEILCAEMKKHDFEQYEISNFCQSGFHSKHNSAYWQQKHYLGLGPSAHSFNGKSRQWNVSNNRKYIKSINAQQPFFETETIAPETAYNEYVLTTLRTIWGCDAEFISTQFGDQYLAHLQQEAQPYFEQNLLQLKSGVITLTEEGKLLADKIASDLFYT
jgi:oxygen-independent coproporphyrinogen-3 oxidase